MFRLIFLLCAVGLAMSLEAPGARASETEAQPTAATPDWFREDVRALSAGSGRWIADNSAYRGEKEAYDAYGTEWTSEFGDTTLSGRLFGLRDGKEVGTFWTFRQYWDPARGVAVLEQFGHGGTAGLGTMKPDPEGVMVVEQTFARPGGAIWHSGHRSRFVDADHYETRSFTITAGTWKPDRAYVWVRQPAPAESSAAAD